MSAITTTFYGPTNYRQSRIRAFTGWGDHRVVVWYDYDYAKNESENHREAAMKCADRAELYGAWLPGAVERGYVFVRVTAYSRMKCGALHTLNVGTKEDNFPPVNA